MGTGAKTSKADGAGIQVTVTQPAGEANIRELQLQLPSRLVARDSTLQKACLAASFETGHAARQLPAGRSRRHA